MAQLQEKKATRTPKQEHAAVYSIHTKPELVYRVNHLQLGNTLRVDPEIFRLVLDDNCGRLVLHFLFLGIDGLI